MPFVLEPIEVFTHVDDQTGIVRVFDVTAMNRYALRALLVYSSPEQLAEAGLKLIEHDLDPKHVAFVLEARGVEPAKLDRLCEPFLSYPTLAVLEPDGTTRDVDGHHRMVRWWREGRRTAFMVRFSAAVAEQFLLEVPPEMREKLVAEVMEQAPKETR
jgi:hypothetical protein